MHQSADLILSLKNTAEFKTARTTLHSMDKIEIIVTDPPVTRSQSVRSTANYAFSNLRRTLSRASRNSRRSYISNLSIINRLNLTRFTKSKITFLVLNAIVLLINLVHLLWLGLFLILSIHLGQRLLRRSSRQDCR